MKSICVFQQLRHQHSISKLIKRGLRKIGLHLFIYCTEHSLHEGELDTSLAYENYGPSVIVHNFSINNCKIIFKRNKPDRANRTPTRSGSILPRPEGA